MNAMPFEARQGALPTGTVTFAFTDIEGSTARWERHPNEMERAVRRHDELMRSAFTSHGGHIFKTVGDAFCVAFWRPADAVAAMLGAQGALAAEDFTAVDGLRVRAAVHTGTASERDGDYFGPAVNRVARLLAIGHGGQVLVSGVTTDLVQGALPSQATLRDLGEHRLRDLARPEQVYQLLAPDLVADFPPLRSLDALPTNLPLQLKSFVGRETEVAAITALIAAYRLVTLVGSGGVGKTRTSLQVAANLLDGSVDGVWFIELAPLASGEYIPSTVAQPLGITLPAEGDPVENLARALRAKHALLVFDNCEHVVGAAARVISAILRECPKIRILASSRQGLGIEGEETYRMPSLDVPRVADGFDASQAIRSAAIALFVERALSADKTFSLTDENAATVADICRRLDGIPLAIELAASRVKILSPRQLRERLDERFRVLTGGSRDVLPRQQTLRALIDWSHDLLDERERVVFRRLGIFVNGFTLEGAVAVCGGENLDELDAIDVLASLVDKSLVLAEPEGDSLRYRLLESTRVYALEKLSDAGERELLATRHLAHLRERFAETWARTECSGRTHELVEAFAAELEDVRFALDGALVRPDIIAGGALLAEIGGSWSDLGLDAEGMTRCERYIASLTAGESQLLARLSGALAYLLNESGQKLRALEVATEAVAHARDDGAPKTIAWALRHYGNAATRLSRFEDADAALTEAEAYHVTSVSLDLALLYVRAILTNARGDFESAARINEQLRKTHRILGNTHGESVAAGNLGECEYARGQTRLAITIFEEMLPALRSGKNRRGLATALNNLAGYRVAADDLPGAVLAAREAIELQAPTNAGAVDVGIAIEHLALVAAVRGDFSRAAALEAYADAALARPGFEREFTETTTYNRLTALLRDGLSPDELARLTAEGAALAPEAAIAVALEEYSERVCGLG
jgi:predicted ATPase/class 3 adenylate cyclase